MSFPDPTQAPSSFGDYLKSVGLHFAQTIFGHYQNRPTESNGRFQEVATLEWCERMDALLGHLNCITKANPDNKDAVDSLRKVCADAVAAIEAKLEAQKISNAAEAMRLEVEEATQKAEEERQQREEQRRREDEKLAEVRARLEQTRKMEEEEKEILRIQCELEAKKQAYSDAQKATGIDIDDAGNDDGSDSAPENQQGSQRQNKTCQKEEACKWMPQTIHENLCENCARTTELICSGPVGQVCDMCWRQKKSCSNGGQRRPCQMVIKEELKSPGRAATRKCKVYSTTDANPISTIKPVEDADTDVAQPTGKRAKTASISSSRVRFDGVAIVKPMRKSARTTKTTSKKELFARLCQEYATIAKMYKELSETWD
ncbi:hypothetical protein PILCRDRAFT_11473 [Piloderma croceum F 1598]|uniref:Uncharacterized protein n=1 Tax=Piloderma croceum (strain F 1598) TaxID=765440 RepID=A0A0C3FDP5_PILCF|nr:hypothetical protein PILCRDRAFT_11473 [Piloderma croceum F 1598]